ncbi:RidA family protein [Virgibacillus halodenitrificans]|uniref:RidA family protein n=1 Tax=Virgibacillus halodenitrificans TaxID=1482 RepID=UPI00136EAEE9|nr:RidA family protein [Virgibacillus halodenitrificans]MEC2157701.1 RidA family protein [Virgibacillus halodenitrificans]MYL57906.1 RidA family protein [Virgibacillus halodenitrificans]
MNPEQRLQELGLNLPEMRSSAGNYVTAVQSGNLLFLSGSLSYDTLGKLGEEVTVENGYNAAKQAGLEALSKIKKEIGDLSRVKKIVKVLAFINCALDFTQQAKVMNGASDLFVSVFGEEIGAHARTSIGAINPRGAAVELEMVVEIK